jgi:methyl-accepting chemotaxis protein
MKLRAKMRLATFSGGLILAGVVAVSIYQNAQISKITERIGEERAPAAQSSTMVLNGVNHSLAALRGWMILENDRFKEERIDAWAEEIDPSLATLRTLSTGWSDLEAVARLDAIGEDLDLLRRHQVEIEDLAGTAENTPATRILLEQAAPRAQVLGDRITQLIDLELTLEATPERKALLGMMADVRGTLGLGLASIRAYLLSGDVEFWSTYQRYWAKNTRRHGDLSSSVALLTSEQKRAFDEFSEARILFDPLPALMHEIRSGAEWNLANARLGTDAAPVAGRIVAALDALVAEQTASMAVDLERADALTSRFAIIEWILLALGAAAFAVAGFYLNRSIATPVALTSEALSGFARGDLTRRLHLDRGDELGDMARSLDRAAESLCELMSSVGRGAEELDRGSDQISASSQQLSETATESASSLEEISASLEEISSMVGLNSDNSQNANRLSDEASDAAGRGAKEMKRLEVAMDEISTSSTEIAKIIKVIDEIAFQTNLLALNAAVEAARAGEAGRGFAVVAEEVRALAQRSAEAARDTGEKIEVATSSARNGTDIAKGVGEALDDIVGRVGSVNNILQEIASASLEQSRGVEQVTIGVTALDKVTQMTAANAEELAATSEESSGQVASLRDLVGRFRFDASHSPVAGLGEEFAAEAKGNAPVAFRSTARKTPASSAPASLIPMDDEEEVAFESALATDADLEEF